MTARQAPSFCQKYRFCYCINVPLLRYLFHAATHRGTSSKTPERGNQPTQDGICGCMSRRRYHWWKTSKQHMEGLGMGWWIVLVVVAGIAVWAICAVRETRRVLDQEGNLLREWEDVQ